MKTQHTPGPWCRNVPPATKYATVFVGRNTHIFSVRHDKSGDESEANHNLICAAPELLEQLERLVNEFKGLPHSLGYEFTHLPAACAAIAKARGEQ